MLAGKGVEKACRENNALKLGLNMYKGAITYKAVAEACNMADKYAEVDAVIA
jgi:alanine dehydrogenase